MAFLEKLRKNKEKQKVVESRDKARLVADLFNTLKKGCEDQEELNMRVDAVKEIDPLFKNSGSQKAKSLEHAQKVIEMAKTTDDETLEKLKKMKALSEVKLIE